MSQTGPGGVGSSANNILWLSSDTGATTVTNNTPITLWKDLSGNANDATIGAGVNEPTYLTNVTNGKPSIRFDGTQDYMTLPAPVTAGLVGSNYTLFSVIARRTLTTANYVIGGSSNGNDQCLRFGYGNSTTRFWLSQVNNDCWGSLITGAPGTPVNPATPSFGVFSGMFDLTVGHSIYQNSTLVNSNANTTALTGFNNPYIGRTRNGGAGYNYFEIDVAEFVIYNTALNSAQRKIVDNYLSAKYNILIANRMFAHQASYPNEVAGIGRDDALNLHNDAQGSSIMRINNPASLDDGDYLFWGHDGNIIDAAWSTTDIPSADFKRLTREWKVDMTGNTGAVDITFDVASLPALPGGYKYVVLTDANGSFSSGASAYEAVFVAGTLFKASGVPVTDDSYITFGVVLPQIGFLLAASNGLENVSTPAIDISLNYIAGQNVTVDYYSSDGTAVGGSDFTTIPVTVATVTSGSSSTTVTLNITDDAAAESDEIFSVTLANPLAPVVPGTISSHTYTINDNDQPRKIEFPVVGASGNEPVSPVTVNVSVDVLDPVNPTTVDYTVTGTASGGGVDYTLGNGTLTIPANQLLANPPISIPIINDTKNENIETIIITLSNPSGTTVCLGANYTYTYSIIDDDPQPTIYFQKASQSVAESYASPVNVVVKLSAASGRNVTVDYAIAGTAIGGGVDYSSVSPGTLTINAGSTSGIIKPKTVNDASIETDETIIFDLSNPNGVTLTSPVTHTLTINDDDFFGWKGPGGVGDDVTNILWLRADQGTGGVANGDYVANWADQSGNTNSAAQANDNNKPLYRTDIAGINSKPVVRFDGTQDFMEIDPVSGGGDGLDELISNSYTVMLVGARRTNAVNYFFSGTDNTTNNWRLEMGFSNTAPLQFRLSQEGNNLNGTPLTSGLETFALFGGMYNSTVGHFSYENGTQLATNTNTTPLNAYPTPMLGRRVGTSYEVDIAEEAVYNKALTTCQRVIVENYLGAKYGLNVLNVRYAYGSDHPNEVAGIGRVNSSDMHTAAKGSGILKVSNASTLEDGDYFLFGHDGGNANTWTTTECPSDAKRMAREWKVDQTGDVGSVTITFYSALAGLPALDADKIPMIMVDADGDFSTGAIVYQLKDNGSPDGFGQEYIGTSITIPDSYYFTFGQITPKMGFSVATGYGQEDAGTTGVTVTMNIISLVDAFIDYSASDITANGSGTDFTCTTATLTIPRGSQTATIPFTITDDALVESSETFSITVSNPVISFTTCILGIPTLTYTINDNDNPKKINFAITSNTGDESFTPITVNVTITNGVGTSTSVNYIITGTAANGVDYTVAAGPLNFVDGATSASISVNVTDDAVYENTETIIITLDNPSADANLGTDVTYTYNLLDNDVAPTAQFTYTIASGLESSAYPSIQVESSAVSGADAILNFTVSGTATNGGVDFTLANGTVTIPAGSTTTNILPVINDDNLIESPETIIITLTGGTGASIGTNNIFTFTILDNDFWGFTGPGGVGDANTNSLWLRADAGTSTTIDGGFVSSWLDQSGNGNDYSNTPDPTVTDDPLFKTNVVSSRPAIRFDGGTDYLQATSGTSDLIGTSYGTFVVGARRTAGTDYFIGGSDIATNDFCISLGWRNATDIRYSQTTANWDGTPAVADLNFHNIMGYYDRSVGHKSFFDGTQISTTTNTNALADYPNPYLARRNATFYDVDIAEVIQYNALMNVSQRIIVENYLASKYGITTAADKYAYEASGHGSEVAGIGRTNASDMHTTARGSGIVKLGDASDLNDGEYLLFGHDGGSIASWTTTNAPADIERLARSWRFDHNGGNGAGTVSLSLDITTLAAPGAGYTKRVVLVDADGNFSSGASVYEMSLDGVYYKAINVNVPDGYYVAFGNCIPKVQFTATTSSGFENVSAPTISIILNYVPLTNVTVDYSSADGPATAANGGGVDYSLSAGTVTIVYGTTTTNITPAITNDVLAESSEKFTITLNTASGGVNIGTNSTHVYTINDDDQARQIDFQLTGASGDESFTPISITVRINNLDAVNPTTVDYTIAGTATGVSDYTLVNGTVTVDPNTTTKVLSLPVIDDLIDENNETVILTLDNPTNGILGTNQVYTYTIVDNDAAPTVQFSSASSLNSEGTSPATVQVSLSAVSGADVTVNYAVNVAGTASGSGVDYSLASGILTIPAGSSSASIMIPIIDDAVIENSETIIIDISSPVNATLGATVQHTLSILDNDDIGFTGPGGVGQPSNNSVWYMTDVEGYANGAPVDQFNDQSGNNNHAASVGVARPVFATFGGSNNKPYAQFDGTDDYLGYNGNDLVNSSYSVITVVARSSMLSEQILGGSSINANENLRLMWDNNNTPDRFYFSPEGSNLRAADNVAANAWGIYTGTFNLSSGWDVYKNEISLFTNAATTPLSLYPNAAIGRYAGAFGNIRISELIEYHIPLNTTQRVIVDNYLSSKYNIVLGANDRFANDATYGNDVIGIGRTTSSDYHTAAKGRGIIKISNAASLDDTDYLLLGHNGGTLAEAGAGHPANGKIINRVWQFDETGAVGTITLDVDASGLPVLDGTYTKYAAIISTDNSFTTTADQVMYELLNTSGSNYQATGVNIGGDKFMTIARIAPKVDFTAATSNVNEGAVAVGIIATLNYVPCSNVTINYFVNGGTATGGGIDYTLTTPGTVTVNAGTTTASISPAAILDVVTDVAETAIIELSGGSSGVTNGTTISHTLTINDVANPLKIDYTFSGTSGDESFTTVNMQVRLNTTFGSDISATYTVIGGTASGGGTDYAAFGGVVTVLSGQTTANISFTVIDDAIDEADETIRVELSAPSAPAILGTNTIHTYTILDNDAQPDIQLVCSSTSGSEGVAAPVLDLILSAVSGQDVTVDYAVTGGTATGGGTDYTLASGTATIPAGSTTTTIVLAITDDAAIESSETIMIGLSAPVGATVGTNSSCTFSIIDNDYFGITGPGGVGDIAAAKNVYVWLRSDAGMSTTTDGDPISQWSDQTANVIHATQATSGNQPTYIANGVNSKPVVRFDGTGDYFVYNPNFLIGSPYSVFTVASRRDANWNFIIGINGGTGNNRYLRFGYSNDNRFNLQSRNSQNPYGVLSVADMNVFESFTGIFNTSGAGLKTIYENNTVMSAGTMAGTTTISSLDASPSIGYWQPSGDFAAIDMAELIMYNAALNTAQIKIVNSYLAAKYSLSISNDRFTFDATHSNEVAGIGRDDLNNFHTAAQGTGIIKISSPSGMGDGDYMLWGHDNGSIAAWVASDVPADVQRLTREWKFDQTGDVGTVSLTAYNISGGIAVPAGNICVLMIDADGDFTSGATILEMLNIAAGTYEATGVTIPDGSYVAVGYITPKVQFTSTASSGNEYTSPAGIQVQLNYKTASAITVNYTSAGVTATSGGVDFTLAAIGSVIIPANSTVVNISPVIINDVIAEANETFTVTLTGATLPVILGTNTGHTFTIVDDDSPRSIQFSSTSSTADESMSPTITIQINNVDAVNPTTVEFTFAGTATGGADYTLVAGIATIPAGSSSTTINPGIVDDALFEASETVIITLSNPTNSSIGMNSVFTYTIIDNETAPTISFTVAASSGSEGSTPALVQVTLSGASGANTTVDYSVTAGSATGGGVDYTLASGTLTILAGSTTGNISITINDDALIEASETITITIANPVNAVLGAITSHVYTINDNDNIGITGPGGVGDGTYNKLWLLSDAGTSTTVNAANLSTWTDQSGAGNDATSPGGSEPQYFSNIINSKPVIRFTRANTDFLTYNCNFVLNTPYTVFAVASRNDNTAGRRIPIFGSLNNTANQFISLEWYNSIAANPNIHFGPNANFATGQSTKALNVPSVFTGIFNSVTGRFIREDAVQKGSTANNSYISVLDNPRIGFVNGSSASIDIAELIQYKITLNTAQVKIVENYLGAKYGISQASDLFVYDNPYGNEVIGIGQDDASNFHTAARGRGIMKIYNPGGLGNGEFLLLGHDGGSVAAWLNNPATDDLPTSLGTERLARIWRFDETGDVGTVSVELDATTLPVIPVGDIMILVVDNNNDGIFASGRTFYPMTNTSGNLWEAINVDITNDNRFIIAHGKNMTIADGNFNTASNWLLNTVPTTIQQAIILNTITLTANQTVGEVFINSGGILSLGAFTLTIDNGTITNNGTLNCNTGTVEYAQNGAQSVAALTYTNLLISNAGGTKTLAGPVSVSGSLTISAGCTLDAAANNISIAGNWINDNIFTSGTGTVNFNGPAAQSIGGSANTTFNNFSITNTSLTGVTLSIPATVNGILTLSDGYLYTDAVNLLTVSATGTSAGTESDNSFIDGPVKKIGNSAFVFPVGDIQGVSYVCAPIGIAAPSVVTDEFTAQFNFLSAQLIGCNTWGATYMGAGLDHVSDLEYWNLSRDAGVSTPAVKIYWKDAQRSDMDVVAGPAYNAGALADIVVSHWNGTKWDNMGAVGATAVDDGIVGGKLTGHVESNVAFTSYSPITYGSKSGSNPLPVNLLSFNAKPENNKVLLEWATLSEMNNKMFTVEKTRDFRKIEIVGTLKGSGNSNSIIKYHLYDESPYQGISYYRLVQADFDSKMTTSSWISVDFNQDEQKEVTFDIFPNLINKGEKVNILFSGLNNGKEVLIVVRDVLGDIKYSKVFITSETNDSLFAIDPSENIPAGIYMIVGTSDNRIYFKKIVIK